MEKAEKTRRGFKISRDIFAIVGITLLVVYVISLFVPLIWAVITSLKTREDFYYNKFGLPEQWMFANYIIAFTKMSITVNVPGGTATAYTYQMFVNGLIYALGCTFMGIMTPAVTAYCVSRYKFFFGRILYGIVIFTMILPVIGNLASELQVARAIGTYNSMIGVWIMKGNFLGMNFLVFHAAFKGLSRDYSEAAFIDGATHFGVFFKIMFPLILPTISTLALLAFIGFWNDYQTPMIYMPDIPTIAYGLFVYQFSTDNLISSVPLQLTGCMIVSIPVMIIFVIFRNKLIMNVSLGGLKE